MLDAARLPSRPFQLPPHPLTAFQLLSTTSTADRHPPPTRSSNADPQSINLSLTYPWVFLDLLVWVGVNLSFE
jgi:hypothetical protein